jgi:hypothetical protein
MNDTPLVDRYGRFFRSREKLNLSEAKVPPRLRPFLMWVANQGLGFRNQVSVNSQGQSPRENANVSGVIYRRVRLCQSAQMPRPKRAEEAYSLYHALYRVKGVGFSMGQSFDIVGNRTELRVR